MAILLFERRACNECKLCDKKVATVPIEIVHTFVIELRRRRLSQADCCCLNEITAKRERVEERVMVASFASRK